MKMIKKITTILLTICLSISCFSIVAEAASGTIVFSDPTTAVGQEVTVDVKLRTTEGAIGDGNITVTYDPAFLEFLSGTNATGGNGTIELAASGDGSISELSYTIVFRALAEGSPQIEVSNAIAYLYNDTKLELTKGNATITIGPGDGTVPTAEQLQNTAPANITINNRVYTIAEDFADVEIPAGFSRTTLVYEGGEYQVLQQDKSEWKLIYLKDEDAKKEFFLYDSETGTFMPFVQVDISEDTFIMLMNKEGKTTLPSTYVETVMTVNDKEFKAWQNTEKKDYFIIYALNNLGTTGYYQYDKVENTYQRFIVPTVEKEKAQNTGLMGKIENLVNNYLSYVLIVIWGVFILFLILIIVLGIKLHNRNRELDDLYDEYDDDDDDDFDDFDDEDEDDEELESPKSAKKSKKDKIEEKEIFDNDFEDIDEEDIDAEDFDAYEAMDVQLDDDDEFEDEFEDEIDLEEKIVKNAEATITPEPAIKPEPVRRAKSPADIEPERRVKKSKNRNINYKRFEDDEDFTVDFIDLDD